MATGPLGSVKRQRNFLHNVFTHACPAQVDLLGVVTATGPRGSVKRQRNFI